MKVIHFVQDISNDSGGLKSALIGLNTALNKKRISTIIYTFTKSDRLDKSVLREIPVRSIKNLFVLNPKNFIQFCREFYGDLLKENPSVIHLHGLWTITPFIGYLISKVLNIPYYLSPHGMLMPYALKKGKYKKKLALFLYQKTIINNSKLIITASDNESSAILNFRKNIRYKMIPHGIYIPSINKKQKSRDYKTALFLGRYNKTKGIDELLKIWSELNPQNWKLFIAGIIEDLNYFKKLEENLNLYGVKNISLMGPVLGIEKDDLFQNADLFILPTKTENFGIVVLEALSYGIPVITTNAAPWEVLNQKEIGWCVNNDQFSLKKVISEATNLDNGRLDFMGYRARKFASQNFAWDEIANQYLETYGFLN